MSVKDRDRFGVGQRVRVKRQDDIPSLSGTVVTITASRRLLRSSTHPEPSMQYELEGAVGGAVGRFDAPECLLEPLDEGWEQARRQDRDL